MSTKQHTNPAYISHVHLKGYKSIIDTEVELHPGLNIIIGPNGSGKTNFLEFLDRVTNIKFDKLAKEVEGELKFYFSSSDNKYTWVFKKNLELNRETRKVEEKLIEKLTESHSVRTIDSEINEGEHPFPIPKSLIKWNEISPSFLNFGIPKTIQNLSQSLSFVTKVSTIKETSNFIYTEHIYNPEISAGIKNILQDLSLPTIYKKKGSKYKTADLFEILIRNLKNFSPVKSVRIMPKLDIVEYYSNYRADFINFEFLVENKWLRWDWLSDGTKRLFYIISEVTLSEGICLVEEPELGVYPDQYNKILNFLQEQAEDKQIIITTHSPRTLDILEDADLNRIILTRYDKDLGTKMRHLNEEEINHAQNKEDGLFMSDLWTWTSFFDEEEVI